MELGAWLAVSVMGFASSVILLLELWGD